MGVVWRAMQIALDRPVALKVLIPELAANAQFRRRFEREARLAARLRHPHVVIVHDAREELGVLLLSMELVAGVDLAHAIQAQGPMGLPRTVDLIEQIAGALDAAHAAGLVHRDVKPANVLIGHRPRDEHAYLTDFGLTTALGDAAGEGTTVPGMIAGTPDYMAPEQVRSEQIDRRADIYALGCVLFELLAERPPYHRNSTLATMVAQVEAPVPSLREAAPDVPAAMDVVVTRALAKAANDRFPSAGDLARAARAAMTGARPRRAAVAGSRTTDWEDHVIVAGLGKSGLRLARGLNDAGFRVVAIEVDETRAPIARLREDGIHVFTGDAADPELLHQARVTLAQHVLINVGDDLSNLNVANVVERERGTDRPAVLTLFVHVDDPGLLRTLTADAVQRVGPRDTRLEFFNARAAGVRLLLARHPPFEDSEAQQMLTPRVLVVGQGSTATELTVAIAAEWQVRRPTAGKLPLMIIEPTADADVRALLSAYPQLTDLCEIEATDADTRSARFQSGDVLRDLRGESTITTAYVAFDDEPAALSAALTLCGRPAMGGVPIVLALEDEASPAAGALRSGTLARDVHPFGVLSAALTPTMLLRGTNEVMARANHANYVRNQRARGSADDVSLVPWDDLPESLKNSNRRFADSVGSALEAIGYVLVPAPVLESGRSSPTFSNEELEHLAQREHDRWIADLLRDGWRFTSGDKDPVRKLHPLLVPWAELSENERGKDRDAVLAIPQLLAEAGLSAIHSRVGALG
jgi:hypothetical protein